MKINLEAAQEGIARNKRFIIDSTDWENLLISYYSAKSYIAALNDAGIMNHEEWAEVRDMIQHLYNKRVQEIIK